MNQTDLNKRKLELLEKLNEGTINRYEAIELKNALEKEKEEATKQGNTALVIGIAILLGFVIKYIADEKIIDKIIKYLSGK
jgi:hypothetical protein